MRGRRMRIEEGQDAGGGRNEEEPNNQVCTSSHCPWRSNIARLLARINFDSC